LSSARRPRNWQWARVAVVGRRRATEHAQSGPPLKQTVRCMVSSRLLSPRSCTTILPARYSRRSTSGKILRHFDPKRGVVPGCAIPWSRYVKVGLPRICGSQSTPKWLMKNCQNPPLASRLSTRLHQPFPVLIGKPQILGRPTFTYLEQGIAQPGTTPRSDQSAADFAQASTPAESRRQNRGGRNVAIKGAN